MAPETARYISSLVPGLRGKLLSFRTCCWWSFSRKDEYREDLGYTCSPPVDVPPPRSLAFSI